MGMTVLHCAAEGGHREILHAMFVNRGKAGRRYHGPDTRRTDVLGRTAIHCAAESGHSAFLNDLLTERMYDASDLCATNVRGGTVLHYGPQSGNREILEIFRNATSSHDYEEALAKVTFNGGQTAWQIAERWGHIDQVRDLLLSSSRLI